MAVADATLKWKVNIKIRYIWYTYSGSLGGALKSLHGFSLWLDGDGELWRLPIWRVLH